MKIWLSLQNISKEKNGLKHLKDLEHINTLNYGWTEKKKTFRLKEDNFYYRIKGKINDFEVWYYVGKLDKHKRP